jgi:hypothetical protein
MEALALTLDNSGTIRDCGGPSEKLFQFRRDELIARHVSLLLPELQALELILDGEANPRLRYQCRIGRHFMAVTRDGEHFASKLFFNILDRSGNGRLTLIIRPTEAARLAPWQFTSHAKSTSNSSDISAAKIQFA